MRFVPSEYQAFHLFLFNDTATTEIYTLSLHDALPILHPQRARRPDRHPHRRRPAGPPVPEDAGPRVRPCRDGRGNGDGGASADRKSTRLNSSHSSTSYAVFCLKKKIKRSC